MMAVSLKKYLEIYPPELELKRKNSSDEVISLMNLDKSLVNKKCFVSLYDKRDSFPFFIVRMQSVK